MTDIVIAGALRTAIGKFGGTLAKVPAPELGATVIRALLAQARLKPEQVSEVILGQVLCRRQRAESRAPGAHQVRHPERRAGDDHQRGLRLGPEGRHARRAGGADAAMPTSSIAGGQENMSASPHVLLGSRDGFRMGDAKLTDTMIVDGLWDVYNQYHMGTTAENVAKKYDI